MCASLVLGRPRSTLAYIRGAPKVKQTHNGVCFSVFGPKMREPKPGTSPRTRPWGCIEKESRRPKAAVREPDRRCAKAARYKAEDPSLGGYLKNKAGGRRPL